MCCNEINEILQVCTATEKCSLRQFYLFVCIWFPVHRTSVLFVKRIRKVHNFFPAGQDTWWRKQEICNLFSDKVECQYKIETVT